MYWWRFVARVVLWKLCDQNGALTKHAHQDIFDVTSVYFPITFTPPPNDPYGISQEDLSAALLGVFRGSPAMAEFVVPLALEKLPSSLINAKMDALAVIRDCAFAFGVEGMGPFFVDLGEAIKAEIVGSESREVIIQALGAVTELASLASTAWESTGSKLAWDQFVVPLLDNAMAQIRAGTATLHGRASCKVLHAVAKSSPHSFETVLALGMPVLKAAAESSQPSQRQVSICTLVSLLQAIDPSLAYPAGHHPLCAYLEDTLQLLRATLRRGAVVLPAGSEFRCSSDSTPVTFARCKAVEGLGLLAGTVSPHPLLPPDVVREIIQNVTNVLGYDADCRVREAALNSLATMAGGRAEYAEMVIDITIPLLMEGVPKAEGVDEFEDVTSAAGAKGGAAGTTTTTAPTDAGATTELDAGGSSTSDSIVVGSGAGTGAGAGSDFYTVASNGCLRSVRALCLIKSLNAITTLCSVPSVFQEVVPQLMRRAVVNRPSLKMKYAVIFSDYWDGKVALEVMKALANIVEMNKDKVENMDSCIGVCSPPTGGAQADIMKGSAPCSLKLIPTLLNVTVHSTSPAAAQAQVRCPSNALNTAVCAIMRTVSQHCSAARQDILREGVQALFLGTNPIRNENGRVLCFRQVAFFKPLVPSSLSRQFTPLKLLADVLGSGRRGAPIARFSELLTELLKFISCLCGVDGLGAPAASAAARDPEALKRYGGDMSSVAQRAWPAFETLDQRITAEHDACVDAAKVLGALLNRQPRGAEMEVAFNAVAATFDNLLRSAASDLPNALACNAVEAFVWCVVSYCCVVVLLCCCAVWRVHAFEWCAAMPGCAPTSLLLLLWVFASFLVFVFSLRVLKGLAVRWYPGTNRLLRKLCEIVTPAVGSRLAANHMLLQCAAEGFGTLVSEHWIFARDCGATVSVRLTLACFGGLAPWGGGELLTMCLSVHSGCTDSARLRSAFRCFPHHTTGRPLPSRGSFWLCVQLSQRCRPHSCFKRWTPCSLSFSSRCESRVLPLPHLRRLR